MQISNAWCDYPVICHGVAPISLQSVRRQTETQDISQCLNSVSKVLLQELLQNEFITRLHHLDGFGTILQKPAVCYIVLVSVHTPLPQYPPGVWQLLSRSRNLGILPIAGMPQFGALLTHHHPDRDPDVIGL